MKTFLGKYKRLLVSEKSEAEHNYASAFNLALIHQLSQFGHLGGAIFNGQIICGKNEELQEISPYS